MSVGDQDARIAELEDELARKDARIAELERQNEELRAELTALRKKVEELTELLRRNSSNSHLPPSSDPPGAGKARAGSAGKKGKSRRKRGGQRGHRGSHRELRPPEEVDEFVEHFPSHCDGCGVTLPEIPDPDAVRHQTTEIPKVKPHTTEHRRHGVCCPRCEHVTRAPYDPEKIPVSPFGPRLMAVVALLTGVYHLSRRKAVRLLSELLGVRISLGAVSATEHRVTDAIEPAVKEAWKRVEDDEIKHTDGTSWLQAGVVLSLWTIATAMATVFKVVASGSKKQLQPLYGALKGILISDRAKALNFWAMERRQICWAHLLRKFVSFSERAGPAGEIGRELLGYTGLLFEYWHGYKDGELGREQFRHWMSALRERVEALLHRGVMADIPGLSGSCKDILEHEAALWTFVDHDGVPPTNNHAEQEVRAFVLWRRKSFGSQSERGNRFA